MKNDVKPTEPAADAEAGEKVECKKEVQIDGFQIAAMRADRKKQTTISVNLFHGKLNDSVEVGRLLFMRKDLPDDCLCTTDEDNKIIILHALVSDFDRMMAMIGSKWRVDLGYCGESEDDGRAYLKSSHHVFPQKEKTPPK
jgi:hypothetical protein